MKVKAYTILSLLVLIVPLTGASSTASRPVLTIKVTPNFAFAPAHLHIIATVPPDADNRHLSIALDSGTFFRASTIQLDGEGAPTTNRVSWKDLPAGAYQCEATLIGTKGARAVVRGSVLIVDSSNSDR